MGSDWDGWGAEVASLSSTISTSASEFCALQKQCDASLKVGHKTLLTLNQCLEMGWKFHLSKVKMGLQSVAGIGENAHYLQKV